ncbi:hypothetical protein GQ53DRAFT_743297 [Thozetella sp. PMI_491]|nr:hypothetical protein GQ53DRAFT_743297 [Thozetella sp. PMI_491]
MSLQRFSATVAGLFLLAGTAGAIPRDVLPLLMPRGGDSIWVSVDWLGEPQTITPIVTTTNGVTTTISAAPTALVATTTYAIVSSGHTTTVAGSPPVAGPTGVDHSGAFMFCDVYQAASPICQPKNGSQLNPGKSYYVTWSSEQYANKSATVQVDFSYPNGTQWQSKKVNISKGFWEWEIEANALDGLGDTPLAVSLFLQSYLEETSNGGEADEVKPGPIVYITKQAVVIANGGSSFNTAAVAVPVVIAVVLLAIAGFCLWRRKKGQGSTFEGFRFRRPSMRQGYGVRKSKTERVRSGAGVSVDTDTKQGGIQLTDRESWSPTSPTSAKLGGPGRPEGRNVFREELQRQERQG